MRLQKYMAHGQVASRRKSEEIIAQGRVTVNGKIETNPAYHVKDEDIVTVDGKEVVIHKNNDYFVLNKPLGIISSVKDEEGRETVIDLINTSNRIYPVGRLDKDTEGLIILTNDGELTNILTHPRYEIPKTYVARVKGNPTEKDLNQLREGIILEGRKTSKAQVVKVRSSGKAVVEITLTEGRNRQVRKMFEAIGYEVIDLVRTRFGEIYLGALEPGSYRKVSRREHQYIENLKNEYSK